MGDTVSLEFLWYIPNTVEPGHRGDPTTAGWGSLEFSTDQARALEEHGWGGALLGASWGRPDTFTVATAIAARTTTFKPLIAIRPGYWQPAHFASAAATLDQLTRGRVLVNIVTGIDNLAAYGDGQADPAQRYDRTREFLQLVRQLWTQENVTFRGEHFQVEASTLAPRPYRAAEGRHPALYFGGASQAAQRVAATEADVQLFWGEPLDGIAERIDQLKSLSDSLGRQHAPLQYGLRITTVVRDTTEEAWRDAEAKVAAMATDPGEIRMDHSGPTAVGQQRLRDLAARGEVLDSCLYTAPGKFGGGGAATTWLVGSAADVAAALKKYQDLGVTHFVLSDTPYQREIIRVGDQLLPLLRETAAGNKTAAEWAPGSHPIGLGCERISCGVGALSVLLIGRATAADASDHLVALAQYGDATHRHHAPAVNGRQGGDRGGWHLLQVRSVAPQQCAGERLGLGHLNRNPGRVLHPPEGEEPAIGVHDRRRHRHPQFAGLILAGFDHPLGNLAGERHFGLIPLVRLCCGVLILRR